MNSTPDKADRNGAQADSVGSHPDMLPPKPQSDAPIIAPFQPPMLSGDDVETPFDQTDRKSQIREYWSQHWQMISGITLIVILLLSAIALVLWNPEKPSDKESPEQNSSVRIETQLSWIDHQRVSIS